MYIEIAFIVAQIVSCTENANLDPSENVYAQKYLHSQYGIYFTKKFGISLDKIYKVMFACKTFLVKCWVFLSLGYYCRLQNIWRTSAVNVDICAQLNFHAAGLW